MALPLWGSLEKSTDSAQTIDEAISAAIDAHDADASAHLGSGASLAAHKAFEVIDHPAGSVVADKNARTRVLATGFAGLSGLSTYGNAAGHFGGADVYTTSSSGNVSQLSGAPNVYSPIDWDNPMYLRIVAKLVSATSQEALLGAGCDDLGDGYSGFGFKIVDGSLYAYHAEDTGSGAVFTTSAISGYTLTDWHTYEAVYDPVAGTLTFFVDGVQEAQFTSGLPTSNEDNGLLLQIKTTSAAVRHLYATEFYMAIDY